MDRRKRHRNSDVARAVRKTRDRLSQQVGNLDFDRELLKLHARAVAGWRSRPSACPGYRGNRTACRHGQQRVTIWALFRSSATRSSHSWRSASNALSFSPTRFRREEISVGHFLRPRLGLVRLAELRRVPVDRFQVIKAMVLLLAMAATAIMASSLAARCWRPADPCGLCLFRGARLGGCRSRRSWPGLLVAALPFLLHVARNSTGRR